MGVARGAGQCGRARLRRHRAFRQGVEAGTLSLRRPRHPGEAPGRASEIAAAVSFLVSDQSRYMNGQTLYVDGGFLVDYGVPLAKKPE